MLNHPEIMINRLTPTMQICSASTLQKEANGDVSVSACVGSLMKNSWRVPAQSAAWRVFSVFQCLIRVLSLVGM